MEITYRQATIKDIDQLVQFRIQFLNELATNDTADKTTLLKQELTTYFQTELEKETVIIYLAAHQQQIVGTSCMVVWSVPIGFDGVGKNGRGYILNMFTLKPYRKKGVASGLLDLLINAAKTRNLEYVHLHATEQGASLYKSYGFEPPFYEELKLSL